MHARYCVSFILTLWLTEEEILGTIRVTLAYRDTLTEGDLDGWQSRESPGTVRDTLAYWDIYSDRGGSGWVANLR